MAKTAFVFPGQGSQSVGMLSELAEQYPQVIEVFDEASTALGYDLWEMVKHDKEGLLNKTQYTQPALLTASVAVYRLIMSLGGKTPDVMAGHSLGEYSALVCAGVLSLADAVVLVSHRGEFMQQAVPEGEGAMYAIIGLENEVIVQACETAQQQSSQIVSAVNFNSPGQVVIAGTKEAAGLAATLCKDAGAKRALPLSVSVPSHCELMQPAAKQLDDAMASLTLHTPEINVVNNVDVAISTSPDEIRSALVRQLYSPVRWSETIVFFGQQGVEIVYEIGPGKVLSGLVKRIDKALASAAVNSPESLVSLTE